MLEEYLAKDINILNKVFAIIFDGVVLLSVIRNKKEKVTNCYVLDMNLEFEGIIGLKKEVVLGKDLLQLFPAFFEVVVRVVSMLSSKEQKVIKEKNEKLPNKDISVSAIHIDNSTYMFSIKDITEQKAKEKELGIYKLIFDNAQDSILHLNEEGFILSANKKAIKKYGYTLEEIKKINIKEIRDLEMDEYFEEQMKISDTSGLVFEGMHIKKDGTSFPVEVSSRSIVVGNEKRRIHIIRDITERKTAEEKILFLANNDNLTGVPNRMNIMKQLDIHIESARRSNYKFAFVLFDLDKFKNINDTYGHLAGDTVLITIAQRVKNIIRQVDFIGRFGGDEFVIILPFIKSKGDVEHIVKKIIEEFQKPIKISNDKIVVTFSMGITICSENNSNKKMLISQADDAMYFAKKYNFCSYEFFDNVKL